MHICGDEIVAAVAVCALCLRMGLRTCAAYMLTKLKMRKGL